MLTEYYKYHEDVPRIFMVPLSNVIHRFYDKKRKINYIKITKMLKGAVETNSVHVYDSDSTF